MRIYFIYFIVYRTNTASINIFNYFSIVTIFIVELRLRLFSSWSSEGFEYKSLNFYIFRDYFLLFVVYFIKFIPVMWFLFQLIVLLNALLLSLFWFLRWLNWYFCCDVYTVNSVTPLEQYLIRDIQILIFFSILILSRSLSRTCFL